ncbi:HAMP domain-containing protein [Altererythrobacter indicus]|uniref:histidine kinase n=1 Tax=Altericroceibacterium indicum TaxID=374177 RepID=A0A845A4F6_9SPHN|nr:ATP-binding protein [Altericroceibacterium indicum]MXP25172.1 HAMP domain-containing protein [Altericroceibacterium indicum]
MPGKNTIDSVKKSRSTPRWWRRTLVTARHVNIFAWLEIVAALLLMVMLVITFIAFSAQPKSGELLPSGQAAALLVGTLIPALSLIVLFGRRRAIKRAGGTSGRLHVKLVFFFSLVAAVPTLMVAVFASFLFQSGVEFWFSDNSRGILENANKLAEGYYEENQKDLGDETIAMAGDLRYYLQQNSLASPEFAEGYSYQVVSRKLNRSSILQQTDNGELRVVAIVDPDQNPEPQRVKPEYIKRLKAGESVVVIASRKLLEAITPIDVDSGIYLYNARDTGTMALSQWNQAQSVLQSYDTLTGRVRSLQVRFNLALFGMSLALVWLSVWFALRFADRQVKPLTELVSAARRVGEGNYALRVDGRTGPDEIGLLNRAFNRMTAQIEQQTTALMNANHQLDDRRAFTEAVLESITAGIISLDRNMQVQLMNSSAQALLLDGGIDQGAPVGTMLSDFAPQFANLIENGHSTGIVQYNHHGELLTLAAKISPAPNGCVITFEDITRQLLDQRQAAWSDVARRIAHEIKNPLTPIQLATERLKRRYRKQIHEDGELFDELTRTIVRQVGDLRKMVDEFSSFARIPKPIFRPEDPVDLVRQAVFLQEVARQDIDFSFESIGEIPNVDCDRHQFGQAMTNVLKNATEAIEAQVEKSGPDYRGRISVQMITKGKRVEVAISDNGIGLPQGAERIVEPYVTTREKGTGLGLAIVKKIIEEHGGEMIFSPAEGGGTRVTLQFALDPVAAVRGSEAAE